MFIHRQHKVTTGASKVMNRDYRAFWVSGIVYATNKGIEIKNLVKADREL